MFRIQEILKTGTYVLYTYRYNLTTDLEIHEDLFSPLIGGELKITLYFKGEPTETQLKVSLIIPYYFLQFRKTTKIIFLGYSNDGYQADPIN